MEVINKDIQVVRKKTEMDKKIIRYLDTHLSERVAIEYEIRKQELHEAIMGAIKKAVQADTIQINTVTDFCILAELDLMLMEKL